MPVLLTILLLSLALNIYFFISNRQKYTVTSVPDGDSLDLASGQRIRLLGLDAPERGRCMSVEARVALEMLTKGRQVRLADTVADDYGRTLANVFVGNTLVNNEMVKRGLAKFNAGKNSQSETIKPSHEGAKREKRGIYSSLCRSTDPETPCTIKGNIREGKKYFYPPACSQYKQVIIDKSFGDAWFCSPDDATTAGFLKSPVCK
jgi:micrococcal nuclease